jgi:hypothetical protein
MVRMCGVREKEKDQSAAHTIKDREAVSGTTSSTMTYMSLDVAVKRWLKVVNFSIRIEMKPNHNLDRQRPARYGAQSRKSKYSLLFLII